MIVGGIERENNNKGHTRDLYFHNFMAYVNAYIVEEHVNCHVNTSNTLDRFKIHSKK